MTASSARDRFRGTLDFLILQTLKWGPRHGYAIGQWLEQTAGDAVIVEEGSLYPSLYRMEQRGWIASQWGVSELGRQAKFYRLTAKGRKQLKAESAEWHALVHMVTRVLDHSR